MDMNIYEWIRDRQNYPPEKNVKHFMYQLIKSIHHIHSQGIYHLDIQPENILIKGDELRLADFGSCRSIYSKPPFTEYVSTRWYKPPECLLTDGTQIDKMDEWGAGCVFFEILSLQPLFPGHNEMDQLHQIHCILGLPSQELLYKFSKHASHLLSNFPQKEGTGIAKLIPHVSAEVVDLIQKLLSYRVENRLSAGEALKHPAFKELREADMSQIKSSSSNRDDQSSLISIEQKELHLPPIVQPKQQNQRIQKKDAVGKDRSESPISFYPYPSITRSTKNKPYIKKDFVSPYSIKMNQQSKYKLIQRYMRSRTDELAILMPEGIL